MGCGSDLWDWQECSLVCTEGSYFCERIVWECSFQMKGRNFESVPRDFQGVVVYDLGKKMGLV